jgi:hypothetical protein
MRTVKKIENVFAYSSRTGRDISKFQRIWIQQANTIYSMQKIPETL